VKSTFIYFCFTKYHAHYSEIYYAGQERISTVSSRWLPAENVLGRALCGCWIRYGAIPTSSARSPDMATPNSFLGGGQTKRRRAHRNANNATKHETTHQAVFASITPVATTYVPSSVAHFCLKQVASRPSGLCFESRYMDTAQVVVV
jgi:hypothetical protein